MEAWLALVQAQFLGFLLILARVGSVLVFAPFFGSEAVPKQVKAMLGLLLALALASALGFPAPQISTSGGWLLALVGEVALGMAIGFVSGLVFSAVQMGGEMIGLQMGFGIVNVIDPVANIQISIIGQFKFILALLVFLAVRGHHMILQALAHSFQQSPPGAAFLSANTANLIAGLFGLIFETGLRVAAPVIVALLVISAATGIISRSVPQVNFLVVGFAFRIGMGLLVLLFGVSFYVEYIGDAFQDIPGQLIALIRTFQGP
jgi:flagellar biosynthetic protein FliR